MAAAGHVHPIIEVDHCTYLLLVAVVSVQQLKGLSAPYADQLLLAARHNDEKLLRSSDELDRGALCREGPLVEQFQFEVVILPDFVGIDQVLLSA